MRFTLLLCALLAPLGSGCFVIASTDDFVQDEGCDLELDLRQFNPHLNQEVQIRLTQLDPGAGAGATETELLAVGIFDPLTNPNVDITLPGAVPALEDPERERPQLDFFADFNGDGVYSDPPQDHTWTVEGLCLPDHDPTFLHNFNFVNLVTPRGRGSHLMVEFCPNLVNEDRVERGPDPLDPEVPLEVRATGTFLPTVDGGVEEERPVGFYRLGQLMRRPDGVRIPAVFDPGFNYQFQIYADQNGNFQFDDGEPAWTYSYVFSETAERCAPLTDVSTCGLAAFSAEVPACLGEDNNIHVRLSRAHLINFGNLSGGDWFSIPEGT